MGRHTGPVCKMCRREGQKLFLKGDRCFMAKCPVETGRPIPGGQKKRRPKMSDYALQLREKQRLKRIYGMREGQFHLFFERATKGRGVTGEKLLQMLDLLGDETIPIEELLGRYFNEENLLTYAAVNILLSNYDAFVEECSNTKTV